jgi:Long-chain acyl-CoA synthetases (AMP-forming)
MYRTVVQMFDERVGENPLYTVQHAKNSKGVFVQKTYIQLQAEVRALAAELYALGLRRGDKVGILSDNRAEWLSSDLAVLALGAADVPRGRDAMDYEITHILSVTEAEFCFVENAEMLNRTLALAPSLPALKHLIVFDARNVEERDEGGITISLYATVLQNGTEKMEEDAVQKRIVNEIMLGGEEDVATVIFTSGTTGLPKGVMLTHGNFLFQLENFKYAVPIKEGGRWLSVLPVWHSFERMIQYVVLYYKNSIAYSKPIGKIMLMDMQYINPEYMGSVPRIWETVRSGVLQSLKKKSAFERRMFAFFLHVSKRYQHYRTMVRKGLPKYKSCLYIKDRLLGFIPYLLLKFPAFLGRHLVFSQITSKLGRNFIMGFSGGGSMPPDVDEFFRAVGINLINGYGLTESGPVLTAGSFDRPVVGFMTLIRGTEAKVVDPEGKELPFGEKGELIVKGGQVMKGYYKDSERTRTAIDGKGFLHTGDLAVMTKSRDISIVGRVKDTIVLSGGENIEPIPIEAALRESEFIETAVVVGQDRKFLSALIVMDVHKVEHFLKDHAVPYFNREELTSKNEVINLFTQEIGKCVNYQKGFKAFEQISRFALLEKPFEVGKELSMKQEVKRAEVNKIYAKEIVDLYR